IYIATFVIGIAGAFESPATAALLPLVTPQGSLQRATAISSGAAQIATIAGPALGGLAYVFAPSLPYALIVDFWLLGAILTGGLRQRGDSILAGAAGDPRRHARPGRRRELPVHQRLQPARPVRKRRYRGAVRRRAGRRARRRRHHCHCAAMDEVVPDAAACTKAGVEPAEFDNLTAN